MVDTAEALAEIGEIDLAIDWARQALDIGPSHQSLKAGEYWCSLLAEHPAPELRESPAEWCKSGSSPVTGVSVPDGEEPSREAL